ncbi:MAG: hypothetical protein Kow00109_12640 [Acidobacteriota bacterium]
MASASHYNDRKFPVMRIARGCWGWLFAVGFLLPKLEAQPRPAPWDFESSLAAQDFRDVDFSPVLSELEWLDGNAVPTQVQDRLRRNLPFLMHQRLDRRRFLVAPTPEHVVERIGKILALGREIDQLRLAALSLRSDPANRRWEGLLGEVSAKATELKHSFGDYFLYDRGGDWLVSPPRHRRRSVLVNSYIAQFNRIQVTLRERLASYFLGIEPGLVAVGEYRAPSILTLAESLRLLSDGIRERLRNAEAR